MGFTSFAPKKVEDDDDDEDEDADMKKEDMEEPIEQSVSVPMEYLSITTNRENIVEEVEEAAQGPKEDEEPIEESDDEEEQQIIAPKGK